MDCQDSKQERREGSDCGRFLGLRVFVLIPPITKQMPLSRFKKHVKLLFFFFRFCYMLQSCSIFRENRSKGSRELKQREQKERRFHSPSGSGRRRVFVRQKSE